MISIKNTDLYQKLSITIIILVLSTYTVLAQYDYSTNNMGGGITYFGRNGDEGEFRIGTSPEVSEDNIPQGKYYNLVPRSFEMPRTNLEYYPGIGKIAISLGFDTSFVSVNDMRYSVVSEDSAIVVGWSPLPQGRWVPQGGSKTILFLDNMDCKNKVLFIKLYHIDNPESVITQIVNTKRIEKARLFGFAMYVPLGANTKKPIAWGSKGYGEQFRVSDLNGMVIKDNVSVNGLGISIHTDVPYFFRAYMIRDIKGRVDTMDLPSNWLKVDERYQAELGRIKSDIDWKKLPNPLYSISIPGSAVRDEGKYKIFVATADYRKGWEQSKANALPPIASNVVSFRVQHDRAFTGTDVLLIVGVLLLLGLCYFLLLKQRQRRRLRNEIQATKEARLSLQAVQSQLNPHFIFNALSGIQNLLNKDENEKANTYLTTFSKLTRSVLNDADKDLIPLKDEVTLLNNYLQMEQLRFGFGYRVLVAADIDDQNTEIPPMLLQPFVENAIKHGIASLRQNGEIIVVMRREHNDMLVEITDNGKGFDATGTYPGKGLALSKSRVSLLNTIYDDIFDLSIKSDASATSVVLKIKNWLK